MSIVDEAVLSSIRPGMRVKITPIPKVPDADTEFVVNEVRDDGFLYGVTETCDGYVMPFAWIDGISVTG